MSNSEEAPANDVETLVKTVTKLLDKAGKDPRVTPRILREKAEQRMLLTKGALKPQREKIKDIIWDWWEKQKTAQLDKEAAILKSLLKLARVSGNVPGAVKGIGDLPTTNEKIIALRERLRAKGLVFSDIPTDAETAAAEKAYQLKQDLDGIDPTLIVNTSRKRPGSTEATVAVKVEKSAGKAESSGSSGSKSDSKPVKSEAVVKVEKVSEGASGNSGSGAGSAHGNTSSASSAAPSAKRAKVEYSDEEAEF